MKKIIFVLILAIVSILVCTSLWAGGGREENLPGIYNGVIPAADCPGIAVVAILNDKGEYKITYQYIDRSAEVVTFTGTFTYNGKTGLLTLNGGNLPSYYRADKKGLTQLDMEGNKITGNLAKNYLLRKVPFSG